MSVAVAENRGLRQRDWRTSIRNHTKPAAEAMNLAMSLPLQVALRCVHAAQVPRNMTPRLVIWPLISAQIVTFAAILWAAIRSIATDDVLTPHVLRDKLRQRARLQ